ncbi:MAG: AAA family ATPase [Candidatus Saccharibacteria bacterium]|nr:AAA family ATPase [Candidatus Saccharibacteria bacterium]
MKHTEKIPIFMIIRGLPGSGKSYLAQELAKQIGLNSVVTLDPDNVDFESNDYINFTNDLKAQFVDEKLFPYRYLRANAYDAIVDNKIIIWNQAFTNQDLLNKTIINLQNYAQEHSSQLKVLIVEMEIDRDVAKKRVTNRESSGAHGVSDEAFQKFIDDYASFVDYGYQTIILDGESSLDTNTLLVKNAIEKL